MSTFVIFPSKDFIFNRCSTFYFVEYVIVNVIIEFKLIITNKVISNDIDSVYGNGFKFSILTNGAQS
jgi:hypothetical protein